MDWQVLVPVVVPENCGNVQSVVRPGANVMMNCLDLTHISPKFAANQLHLDSYCLPDATTRPACHQWTNGPKSITSWTNSIQKSDVNVL